MESNEREKLIGGRVWFTIPELLKLPPLEWIVKDVIPENSVVCFYGAPGSMKSFLALDLCMSIAAREKWANKETQFGCVAYVAAEGMHGVVKRIRAWLEYHFVQPSDPDAIFHLEIVNLMDIADTQLWCEEAWDVIKYRPTLIVLDTLARCAVGADENSARDMGIVIQSIDTIRRYFECTVLVIHHTQKSGENERGSSALRGAFDMMAKVTREGKNRVAITCDKMKDAEEFDALSFTLEETSTGAVIDCAATMTIKGVMVAPIQVRILYCAINLDEGGGVSSNMLINALGMAQTTFHTHRKTLLDRGLLNAVGEGRSTRYVVPKEVQSSMPER